MSKTEEIRLEKRLSARRILLTSFLVDLSDVILSFIITLLSGSVIMLSQLLEGISDLTSSGFLLIGFRRSLHKEDRTHPFGYGREIYIWTLLSVATMFGITSTLSFYLGLQRFIHPEQIHDLGLAIIILVITFITNLYAFSLSLRRLLRRRPLKHIMQVFFRSSLIETKTTFTLDLMGTLASLFGAISLGIYYITGDYRFDGIGAMVVAITLAIFSIFLILGIVDLLIGKSASEETEEKIKQAALSIEGVNEIVDLKTLHVGSEKLLVNLDVNMEQKLKTKELEKMIDKIEWKIRQDVPSAKYVLVELESSR
jgi:cation diffusion facilitator family transporter